MFSKSLKFICLSTALSYFWLLPSPAEEKWENTLKMSYSGDKLVFLRQFTHDPESTGKSYFEFYQLNLKTPEKHPRLDCSNLIPVLSKNIKTKLQQTSELKNPAEIEAVFPTTVAETQCADINQNGQPEILLKVSSGFYFGKTHYGVFLYEQNGQDLFNLLGSDPAHLLGDQLKIRTQDSNDSGWPDLLNFSQDPRQNKRLFYIEPLSFSTTAKRYESESLKYAPDEKIFHTKDKKLVDPEFNASHVKDQKFVLNRNGGLIGMIHTESVYPSSFFAHQLMVIETQTGRSEAVYIEDPDKSLIQGVKQRFPKYMQTPGFANLEAEVMGFNQDNLIFKAQIFGSCHHAMPGPPCDGNIAPEQIEKIYPQRFAGYWAYHYRTGALKLISWDSKTPINVEHTGYDIEFR